MAAEAEQKPNVGVHYVKQERIPCEYCGELHTHQRLNFHIAAKHFGEIAGMKAELADVKTKLQAALENQKAVLADHPAPAITDEDRKAVLSDWLSGMTFEAWEEIGKQAGYFTEGPAQAAEVADAKPQEKPENAGKVPESPESSGPSTHKVLLAQHSIVATVADKKYFKSDPCQKAYMALRAVEVSLSEDEYYQHFKPLLKTVQDALANFKK